MRLSVHDIRDVGLALEFVEPAENFPVLAELQERRECRFPEPLQVALRIQPAGGLFEVSGRISTRIQVPCSRCLKPTLLTLDIPFELSYARELPEIDVEDDEEGREISAEEMGLILLQGDEIDLREAVQEQVVLAIPFHPLCTPGCRGLCPQCGADLNEETCRCAPTDFNLKFAALKDFKINK
ncbi:YceD family protein [Trichloromonas sp.]|uniref:YceD family protein n=1 Tax=Trichloromonas sp. TaxID=3069249 RepID=UPI002A4BDAE3|nr:DUF177 domain-containing protein [Trichloromonas sp.]